MRKMSTMIKQFEYTHPFTFTMDSVEASRREEVSKETKEACMGPWRPELRCRRLELPMFDGENPEGWILKVERYFHVNQILETEKLEAVAKCLEGGAL